MEITQVAAVAIAANMRVDELAAYSAFVSCLRRNAQQAPSGKRNT